MPNYTFPMNSWNLYDNPLYRESAQAQAELECRRAQIQQMQEYRRYQEQRNAFLIAMIHDFVEVKPEDQKLGNPW